MPGVAGFSPRCLSDAPKSGLCLLFSGRLPGWSLWCRLLYLLHPYRREGPRGRDRARESYRFQQDRLTHAVCGELHGLIDGLFH